MPPFGPQKPSLHRQSEEASLPDGELESAGHARQAFDDVAPAVLTYLPPTQS